MTQQTYGKYTIIEQIGQGGFATVYRAQDTVLDRTVALKVLDPLLSRDQDARRRFLREARTAAKLSHPHIVTIFEVEEAESEIFIAMEYLPGQNLGDLIGERGRLSVDEALPLLTQIADALDYAHSHEMVHRDLKPANILVSPQAWGKEADRATITDFGLVKVLSSSLSMSSAGRLVGSPEYMAPEQCDPNRMDEVGPATDYYALGIVAYQMLTGRVPFPGATPATLNAHMSLTPPDPAKYAADLPPALSPILLRALAKEPGDRYASAAAFVQALADASDAALPAPVAAAAPAPERESRPARPAAINVAATQSRAGSTRPVATSVAPAAAANRSWLPYAGVAVVVLILAMIFWPRGGDDGGGMPTSVALANSDTSVTVVIPATETPVPEPNSVPTEDPTPEPTLAPTEEPTVEPTSTPSSTPNGMATAQALETRIQQGIVGTQTAQAAAATPTPTRTPTSAPTRTPTPRPTATATPQPTNTPNLRVTQTREAMIRSAAATMTAMPTNTPRPIATRTRVPTATRTPVSTSPKSIVICQAQEPDTLYEYGGSMLASSHVKAALGYNYGFIAGVDFGYQPVALVDLPTLDNGGAVLETVTIRPGSNTRYIDPATGETLNATGLSKAIQLDQITMTFKIRPGMLWEDGTPITAADYELSFRLYMDPNTPNSNRLSGERTAEFTMLDDHTQLVKLLPGITPADYFTYFWGPFPAHVLGGIAPSKIPDNKFARAPLSYGPFKVAEWVEGQYIRVVKNENYWRKGYPKLDEVIYKFVPDTNQLLAQLLSGECDVGTEDGMDLDQSPFLNQAEAQGSLVPFYKRGTVWEHIDFGMTSVDGRYQFFGPLGYTDLGRLDTSDPASWVGTPAWEAAKTVRKAVAHCIDRQRIVDEAMYGRSAVIHSFIPENHPMYPVTGLTQYEYDSDLGKKLLASVGWTDTNGDGFVDRKGIKFEMTLNTTSNNSMREVITQVVQKNMRTCGVDVNIELISASVYFGDGPDGPLFGRAFDLGEFAWLTGVEPPVNLYYCDQWPTQTNGWAGQNNPGYCNPAYDALGKQTERTLSREAQAPLYAEAQAIFSDDLPVLPLFQRISVSATRPGILNYMPNPTIYSAMWNIWEWDIK